MQDGGIRWQEILSGLGANEFVTALLAGHLLPKAAKAPKYKLVQVGVVDHWPERTLRNGLRACVLVQTPLMQRVEIPKKRKKKKKNPPVMLAAQKRRCLRDEKRLRDWARCQAGTMLAAQMAREWDRKREALH